MEGQRGNRHTMATTSLAPALTQKVVVVNGSAEALGVLETLLDAGHYDMVFVESSDRAYSTIKRVLPHLIVLCTGVDSLEGVQLLTMLRLDAATRDIPVLSYTSEGESQDYDAAISEIADEQGSLSLLPARPAMMMN
jgi:PleD family two-component response regulator